MTYPETLDYLFRQLPMYQRIGQAAYKADLSNTEQLMEVLYHPEHNIKAIHVAGTNGKGSVSHLLASIFREAGYKTGLYTSPHLTDFRERIQIDEKMISEAEVISFVTRYKSAFEPLNLSFFEWSVGLAFDHFREHNVDIAIVEVGMGGRLDSTNVLNPEISIITNIGLDHSEFLGSNISQIAIEKAGIIKPQKPVVIGKSQRETESIFRKIALDRNAPLTFADQQFPEDVPECPLKGQYQKENFQTVLVACKVINGLGYTLSEKNISSGFQNVLTNTGLRGRWQVLDTSPKTICDVGHNVEGIKVVAEQLKHEEYNTLRLVLGFVSDKSVSDVLRLFPENAAFYLTEANIPRAMPIERLSQVADEMRIEHHAFSTVKLAYIQAVNDSQVGDLIFVGGSTFVVADLLTHINDQI